jgi:UDP-2,4-diacetamido-2,4,6-trideoxy-beta-L-altropyranose hydrolase
MSQLVFIRTDASLQIGSGHVMRCLTLAEALQDAGGTIAFITRNHLGNLNDYIKSKGFNVYSLPNLNESNMQQGLCGYEKWLGVKQEQDAKETIQALSGVHPDWLIVDHYALNEDWETHLRKNTSKLMVIDDLSNRQFDCDILLNQNLGSKKNDYQNKVPKNCQLLLGCDYALLRPEFAKLRKKALEKRKNTKKIKNILVSMGGIDNQNITYEILQQLNDKFNIVVVLGGSSPWNEMIIDFSKDKNIDVFINTNNMAELMLNADLAIGAGGSTSWERCCMGLPTLLFITADNQIDIAKNLEKRGAIKIVNSLKKDLAVVVNDFSLWRELFENSKNLCDGLGPRKVIDYVK